MTMHRNITAPLVAICLLFLWEMPAHASPIRVIVLGDSLTYGYQLDADSAFSPMLERKMLSEGYQAEVINMSVSGDTSAMGLARLDEVIALDPDIVLVQLGLNDALRGIDPQRMLYNNIFTIVSKLKANRITVVLVGATPPPGVDKEYIRQYQHINYKIARHFSLSYYPDLLEDVTGRADLTLADGLHPNAQGVLAMVHGIYPYIEPYLEWLNDLQAQ